MTKFIGCSRLGNSTSTTHITMKMIGNAKFTLIGRGKFGLQKKNNLIYFYGVFFILLTVFSVAIIRQQCWPQPTATIFD